MIKCSNCGNEIYHGDPYFPAHYYNMGYFKTVRKDDKDVYVHIRTEGICKDCIDFMMEDYEEPDNEREEFSYDL